MRVRAAILRAQATGEPFQFQQRILRMDDAVRVLRTRGRNRTGRRRSGLAHSRLVSGHHRTRRRRSTGPATIQASHAPGLRSGGRRQAPHREGSARAPGRASRVTRPQAERDGHRDSHRSKANRLPRYSKRRRATSTRLRQPLCS